MAELSRGQILKNPEILGATTTGAKLIFWDGDETNTITLQSPDSVTANYSITLPPNDGDAGQFLRTDGNGVLTWEAPSATAGGSSSQIQYNNSGALTGAAGLTTDGTNLTVTAAGEIRFADTAGGEYVAFKAPGTVAANRTYTLPAVIGSVGQVLGIATGASATVATLEWVPAGTNITVSATAPSTPAVGDLWVDTN